MKGLFNFMKNRTIFTLSATATFAMAVAALKDYMQGPQFKKNTRADGKVVIVTGANTGIGKETALELAKRGALVYMVCRDMEKCKIARDEIAVESKNRFVFCRECDLASFKSIRQFASKFKEEQPKLDILVNNAGVMRCPRTLTKDGLELQLGVNHMGHFLLTNLLLDHLKKAVPSRIVVVSSIGHFKGTIKTTDLNSEQEYDPGQAYYQSKLANILFTKELAKKLQGTGVTVNALHPGMVNTEIIRHMSVFNVFVFGNLVKAMMWPFVKKPMYGAQTTLYAALEPSLSNKSGLYFSDCEETRVADAAQDPKIAEWLWKVSEKWTGCTYT